ncbi:calcium/proton exchanger [bacterium]|nr:MAG: calcium/proton exchanger [bacterium]
MRWLLALVPISLAMEYLFHAPPTWVFVVSVLAIVPLASMVKDATEQIASRMGSTIGGLLNVSFGNAAELILALFVLAAGEVAVAKAQITGSLIGNSLLGLGLGATFGGIGRIKQTFNRERVGVLSSLLVLVVFALLIPAMFDYTERGIKNVPDPTSLDERMSLGVSVVLILIYVANLVYTLVTHRDAFAASDEAEENHDEHLPQVPLWRAIATLLGATVLVAIEAEMISGGLDAASSSLGLSKFFLGITVLAVVGNAAEYLSAVYFARKGRMDLVMGITLGSTIQVALLVAPILVISSFFLGHPMTLVFRSPLELVAVAAAAFAVNAISQDGSTNWFEGVLLLGVYLILCIAFFYVTP